MLRLTFHGAALGVTGSCFLLETSRARVLIDCGLFQGSKTERELNYRAFPFRPDSIDAVVLTHAHIDHSGLLPKLARDGFRGPVHATRATMDLCSVMLADSGHIQEMEVKQLNRRNARRGRGAAVEPIYTAQDAAETLRQFRPASFGEWINAADGVRAKFWNAGHLLGSASAEIEITTDREPTRLLFSGDLGPTNKLLQFDPEGPFALDFVICEATYGDADRPEVAPTERRALLRQEVLAARADHGGALLIPSFAVERTQELLVDLVALMESGALPEAPVFIDSPLAARASAVFAAHAGSIENGDTLRRALKSRQVRFTETMEQSKAIDRTRGFRIIMAGSGMCEAGRIRRHLKEWLWRDDAAVLLVGYQAQGTLGRVLQEGASRVRIQGDEIVVRARVRSLDLYSGHADAPQLAAWLRARLPVRRNVFLVHGEAAAIAALKARVSEFIAPDRIFTPRLDETFELSGESARQSEDGPASRIRPEDVGRPDWRNDLARLQLEIGDTVQKVADERVRRLLIQRLRRALDENGPRS